MRAEPQASHHQSQNQADENRRERPRKFPLNKPAHARSWDGIGVAVVGVFSFAHILFSLRADNFGPITVAIVVSIPEAC